MNLNQLIKNHYDEQLSEVKIKLLEKLKLLDDKLLKSKSKNLKVASFCKRTIWTPQTDLLTFSRRRYFDQRTKKYRYLLDEKLQIEKYKFVSKKHQKLALIHFASFRSYRDIAKIIFNGRVSKMSIHNFIKNYESKFSMDNFVCEDDGILKINCDGMWIKQNRKTKALEVRNFVFFTNRKLNDKTRKWSLVGKTLKHFVNVSTNKIVEILENIISQYDQVREIRLTGDGAKWIKEIAKKLNAVYHIDKFHMHKAINDLVGKQNKDEKQEVFKLLYQELKAKDLRYELLMLVANHKTGEVSKKQIKLVGYIVNNNSHYIRNIKYNKPINCIEAMQSHYQARYFKNQRKGWSLKILNKIINFLYSHLNGGVFLDEDIGKQINFPLFSDYGVRANVPALSSNRRLQSFIYKK